MAAARAPPPSSPSGSFLPRHNSGSRMKTAGRFKPCIHMGCFDLDTSVELNQRSRKWQCPICLKNYSLENLMIDPYFNRITSLLRDCCEDVNEIDINPDGSWRVKGDVSTRELSQWHMPDGTLCISKEDTSLIDKRNKNLHLWSLKCAQLSQTMPGTLINPAEGSVISSVTNTGSTSTESASTPSPSSQLFCVLVYSSSVTEGSPGGPRVARERKGTESEGWESGGRRWPKRRRRAGRSLASSYPSLLPCLLVSHRSRLQRTGKTNRRTEAQEI